MIGHTCLGLLVLRSPHLLSGGRDSTQLGVVVWGKGSDGWRGLCALPGRQTGAARPGGPGHWVCGLTVADDRGASFPRALRKLCCG